MSRKKQEKFRFRSDKWFDFVIEKGNNKFIDRQIAKKVYSQFVKR